MLLGSWAAAVGHRRWLTSASLCSRLPCRMSELYTAASSWHTPWGLLTRWLHTHTRLTALCPGLPRWAGARKVKPIWILLEQETVSGSGISWAIMQVCISLQADNHASTPPLSFYRPDALPATQPTASKYWRHIDCLALYYAGAKCRPKAVHVLPRQHLQTDQDSFFSLARWQ